MAARTGGAKGPRAVFPAPLARIAARPFSRAGGLIGLPPNLRELSASTDGYTYWWSSAKAREELGWAPRTLADGLRATIAAAGHR
jgi:nucleoside-diphosphate-sugar epimerase